MTDRREEQERERTKPKINHQANEHALRRNKKNTLTKSKNSIFYSKIIEFETSLTDSGGIWYIGLR